VWPAGGGGNNRAVPHNVLLDKKWILVVPRRIAGLSGAVANAVATMLGMVWVSDEEKLGI
jgi:ATP adenylyltransferase